MLSRILASRFGAFLTFGALSKGRESAPGQPLISDLRARYRSQGQTCATKVLQPLLQATGGPVGEGDVHILAGEWVAWLKETWDGLELQKRRIEEDSCPMHVQAVRRRLR